jgi:hypothetical protein
MQTHRKITKSAKKIFRGFSGFTVFREKASILSRESREFTRIFESCSRRRAKQLQLA